jgi:monoamine oxidase
MALIIKPKIAIVGAGLAGLTAALRLYQQDFPVEIFEARERVGGRVFSAYIKNYNGELSVIEFGGQNITDGGDANNILKLVDEFDLAVQSKYITLSRLINYSGQYSDFRKALSEEIKENGNIFEKIDLYKKTSKNIEELLSRIFPNNPKLMMALNTLLTAYEGVPTKNQSIYHNIDTLVGILKGSLSKVHKTSADTEGDAVKILVKTIEGGNALLPIKMAEVLNEKLHFNKVLLSVELEGDKVKLGFADNSVEYFDKLILAVPIAVYNDIDFDEHLISQERMEAFNSVEYGVNYKLLVPYDTANKSKYRGIISEDNVTFFNDDENILLSYFISEPDSYDKQYNNLKNFYNIKENDLFIANEAIDINYSTYDNSILHNWGKDPYAKSSYSGYGTKLDINFDNVIDYLGGQVKEIFMPVENKLYFIGEHATSLDVIGTMEAAVESAEQIVKIIMNGI